MREALKLVEGDAIAPFPTGAVVALKSGGMPMTVGEPVRPARGLVACAWFTREGDLMRDKFHADMLETAEPVPWSDM